MLMHIHPRCLKRCAHFSVHRNVILIHACAKLYITLYGLLFNGVISTGMQVIIFTDPTAHLICILFTRGSVLQHVKATPMLSF